MTDAAVLEARALSKTYRRRDGATREVLRGVDLAVPAAQIVGIHGEAASGKTALLRVLSALDRPTSGEILYAGRSVWRHSWRGWRLRVPRPAFALPVFANPVASLDPVWPLWRTVTEAACTAGVVSPRALAERRQMAEGLLARAGLTAEQIDLAPKHLTESQCQRVAILRVIAAQPAAVLLDEPMRSVEDSSRTSVLWMLRNLAESGAALILFSADRAMLTTLTRRVLELQDGRISDPGPGETATTS